MASLVFKVKYENTLRRFNVAINEDQRLDLSMESLKLKIRSLFNLPSDTEFRLTYNDEDDDLVTLVDDDDLHDVVTQGLDPVRITVHLNSDKSGQYSSASFGGSAARSTPLTQNVQPNVSSVAAEVLKAVQEPLSHVFTPNFQKSANNDVEKILRLVHEPLAHALSTLALGISSKSASTSPIVGDPSNGLSKKEDSCVNETLSNSAATSVSDQKKVSTDSKTNSVGENHEGSQNDNSDKRTVDAGVGLSVKSPLCKNPSSESSSNKTSAIGGMKKSNDASCQLKDMTLDEFLRAAGVAESEKDVVKDAAVETRGTDNETVPPGECPFSGILLMRDQSLNQTRSSNRSFNKAGFLSSVHHIGIICDGCEVSPIVGPRFESNVKYDYDLCSSCFSKMGNLRDYTRIDFPKYPPSYRAPNADNFGPIFHKGVGCDGCGAIPIIGPRFMSKVKNDYDLCNICFSRMGNDLDYIRIDFSWPSSLSRAPGLKDPFPHITRPRVLKHRSKLESCFISDVTITDGTTMAPSTPFTKIWRMRNIGTLPWNTGLQLLWIGGDRFCSADSIKIQVPITGVNVGSEYDIAVDFIAPELPGQYISYWRMADPSGHKFGQRVWVQIQVDPSVDLTRENSSTLDLNLPPDSKDTAFPEVADIKAEPGLDKVGESDAQSILDQNHKIEMVGLNLAMNGASQDMGNLAYPTTDTPVSPVGPLLGSDPKVDKLGESLTASTSVQKKRFSFDKYDFSEEMELHMKELEQAGFKQIDSEKEVVPMNELDLDVSEWDPILEELKEMGFEDKDTNKKLLAKNNGSISRVVMDLIADEKA